MEPFARHRVELPVRKLVIHFLLAFSVWVSSSQNGSVAAQSRTQRGAKIPSLSLCRLTRHMDRYVGRIVRVQLTILGIGGHSPFFIAAQDCQSSAVTIIWANFDSQQQVGGQLENKFLRAANLNSDHEESKAPSFLIGRIRDVGRKHRSGYNLMISIRDVETIDPEILPKQSPNKLLHLTPRQCGFKVTSHVAD